MIVYSRETRYGECLSAKEVMTAFLLWKGGRIWLAAGIGISPQCLTGTNDTDKNGDNWHEDISTRGKSIRTQDATRANPRFEEFKLDRSIDLPRVLTRLNINLWTRVSFSHTAKTTPTRPSPYFLHLKHIFFQVSPPFPCMPLPCQRVTSSRHAITRQ